MMPASAGRNATDCYCQDCAILVTVCRGALHGPGAEAKCATSPIECPAAMQTAFVFTTLALAAALPAFAADPIEETWNLAEIYTDTAAWD